MSHDATNWAIKQRGLKPAAKIVLWHLCDRYNPDMGCFPSQETLADDCELSRSSLNDHLDALAKGGLIARERRHDKGGKRARTRYRLAFETGFEPERPCPEIGHGEAAETMSENRSEPCPENAENHVRISDSNPVREPVKEPVSERERASADAEAGEGKPDPATVPGRADFQKRVVRLCSGEGYSAGKWPDWDAEKSASLDWIEKRFAELDESDRQHAERWRDGYLRDIQLRRLKPKPIGIYIRDRMWEGLDPMILVRADKAAAQGAKPADLPRPDGSAVAMGPVWSACLHERLLEGPRKPEHAPPVGGLWLPAKLALAWSEVHGLLQMASLRRSAVFAERWHAMRDRMEFVPLDSPVFAAWRDEYRRRGWPAMPVPEDGRGAYFPKGGPEGLSEFEAMLASAKQEQVA